MGSRRRRQRSDLIDGDRLRAWREHNGMTQDMAAKAFGYSRETWNRFENGDPIAKPVIMAISYHEQLQELRVQLAEALDVGGASLARRDAPARR